MEFLKKINGTRIEEYERKDFEIYYLKDVLVCYLKDVLQTKDESVLASVEDPGVAKFVEEFHPRFYELVAKYGSPLELINLKKEANNIASTAAKIEIVSEIEGKEKSFKKKLLLNMTVTAIKAMCSKLFKMDVLTIKLYYRGPEDTQDYELDEEYRQLSFYSMADGGKIKVQLTS